MKSHLRRVQAVACFVCLTLVPCSPTFAASATATFENFSTQLIHGTFVDPLSDIVFANPQFQAGYFGIQQTEPIVELPDFFPTTYLTGNGVGPSGFEVCGNFGFDAYLPGTAHNVALDVLYYLSSTPSGTLTLTAYDIFNNVVGTTVVTPPALPNPLFHYAVVNVSVETGVPKIHSFTIRANDLSTSYDNVAFTVPEPSTLALATLAIPAALLYVRRKSRR